MFCGPTSIKKKLCYNFLTLLFYAKVDKGLTSTDQQIVKSTINDLIVKSENGTKIYQLCNNWNLDPLAVKMLTVKKNEATKLKVFIGVLEQGFVSNFADAVSSPVCSVSDRRSLLLFRFR